MCKPRCDLIPGKAVTLYYRITDYDTQVYSFPQANNSTSYRYHTFKSLPLTLQQMFLITCLYTIYSFATDVFTIIYISDIQTCTNLYKLYY